MRLFWGLAGATFAIDQVTKTMARAWLASGQEAPVLDGVWVHRLAYNSGAAFSSFTGGGMVSRVLLSIAAIGVAAGIVYAVRRMDPARRMTIAALALIAGGALGNGLDRLRSGVVTDFIVWRAGGNEWPAFNIADAGLLVGVVLLVFGGSGMKLSNARAPRTPR